ncbi:LysR family transcriptional regulator [Falsirhodobacter sp. 20TX0035]|uniref:LysR family transcriptional regulator n=1 Tax=Falsirhodobacter sp. 20TX0035 TaxID=3022019 RepID=UPI00232E44B8|nr:LysR family transcriptional regulator [Falsirhodobacter sp. 20TX0035]MDB6454927.1 LysR family transcriptional regulator [Falsirhodobacter sp. 20TX0035]
MNTNAAQTITLRQIRAFIAVARESSFTRAAEAVHLTQPALTSCIRQLEDRVGATLFERTTRQVTLSRYGEALLPTAERMVRDLDAALAELRALQDGTQSDIAIATVPSIASSIMPQSLAAFSMLHPKVGISLTEDHSEGVRRKVLEGEADFGFGGITEPFADIEAVPMFYDLVGLFCHADDPLAKLDRPLHWADLAGREIFNMGYQTQIREIIDVVPELAISFSQTAYRVRNTLTTLSMIRGRNAVAALPRLSIPPEALTDVVFKPLIGPELRRDIFLCRRERSVLTDTSVKLIREIRGIAAKTGATLYAWDGI